MLRKDFEIDESKYLWNDTDENTYPGDYQMGATVEEDEALKARRLTREASNDSSKVREKLVSEFFMPKVEEPEVLFFRAQILALEYARSQLHYELSMPRASIDLQTDSDSSVTETERWWSILEATYQGDWVPMLSELYRQANMSFNASTKLPEVGVYAPDFDHVLQEAWKSYKKESIHSDDSFFEDGVSLYNLLRVLEYTLAH